jgi:hypothetical protein
VRYEVCECTWSARCFSGGPIRKDSNDKMIIGMEKGDVEEEKEEDKFKLSEWS